MNNAIWCAQNLRLGQMSGITSLTSDVKEQAWAMRMFWYLYGLAQPYCLRWGIQQVYVSPIPYWQPRDDLPLMAGERLSTKMLSI